MSTTLRFTTPAAALEEADAALFVGRPDALSGLQHLLPPSSHAAWARLVDGLKPGDQGASSTTWLGEGQLARVAACGLPDAGSRYNCPARPDVITSLVRKAAGTEDTLAIVIAVDDAFGLAAGLAAARAFPRFHGKGEAAPEREVRISLVGAAPASLERIADGVRLAAQLVDMPTSELNVDRFATMAREVADAVGARHELLGPAELKERGFGGLWGVGKAATSGPALVILSHEPEGATETVAWVGKGIVYDTGGLSLKGKDHMPGMKIDMGGAAAVLGAFQAAAAGGAKQRIHALLCLAENSVGPDSTRPDDILHMYSGRTVEVNNTDAEGRLVLADGVAYASRHLSPGVIVDLATLTGAQLVATGRRHAAIVCNRGDLEARAVAAGHASGDLVHPLPYVPEFYRKEFKSEVADMKNSVKDRMNAQSSCAGQFVAEHLDSDWEGGWLHIDLAGPVSAEDRGTGFGVALLLELLGDR